MKWHDLMGKRLVKASAIRKGLSLKLSGGLYLRITGTDLKASVVVEEIDHTKKGTLELKAVTHPLPVKVSRKKKRET